jgi:hypothetical protein
MPPTNSAAATTLRSILTLAIALRTLMTDWLYPVASTSKWSPKGTTKPIRAEAKNRLVADNERIGYKTSL